MNKLGDSGFSAESKYNELIRKGYPSEVAYKIATTNTGLQTFGGFPILSPSVNTSHYEFHNENNRENDKKKLLLI